MAAKGSSNSVVRTQRKGNATQTVSLWARDGHVYLAYDLIAEPAHRWQKHSGKPPSGTLAFTGLAALLPLPSSVVGVQGVVSPFVVASQAT